MAIHREVYRKVGQNDAQIDAAHDWATALRVRMTDAQMVTYGACNVMRLVNNSTVDLTISWTWDVGRTNSEILKANSVRNITVEDGVKAYGFDVYSADAAVNIAISEFKYKMALVKEIPEDRINGQ